MDFGQILHTAQKLEKSKDQKVRYYSTKFEPPKKEKKETRELSNNIKNFLAKKEAEEKRKNDEEKKKRDQLLALRSQDKKAAKRVNHMLKRTKSANQSVIEDAIDNVNTAVTLAGPIQPDEDDYGYVSQEASQYYAKMMEKYSKMPDEPKFNMAKKKVSTNLGSTMDRVKAAIQKEKEDALLPHKRKRKHKEKKDDDDEEGVSYDTPDRSVDEKKNSEKTTDREKMPPPKPKPKPAPPLMNFAELLKIAAKKQHEPIIIEKKEKDDERLLTKKQRKEIERERESQIRREERRRHQLSNVKIPKAGEKEKLPLSSSIKTSTTPSEKQKSVKFDLSNGSDAPKSTSSNDSKTDGEKSDTKQGASSKESKEKQAAKNPWGSNKKKKEMEELFPEESRPGRKYLPGDMRYKAEQRTTKNPPSDIPSKKQPEPNPKTPPTNPKIPPKPSSSDTFSKKPLPTNSQHTQAKKVPASDSRPSKEALPRANLPQKRPTMEAQSKRFPPEDVRRKLPPKLPPKQFPPPDVRRNGIGSSKLVPNKRGRILDDDEDEYDSEMDDFIDDGDAGEDISKYISEIFGYDKMRYRDVDEDDDNMETSFSQQMKEEVISTKIGIMEDLEEERKEEAARRKKIQMKKKMRMS